MPCRDYYDDHPEAYFGQHLDDKNTEIEKLQKQVSFAESALCATLNTLEDAVKALDAVHGIASNGGDVPSRNMYDYIDFVEAGITRQDLQDWREHHQKLDAQHRALE